MNNKCNNCAKFLTCNKEKCKKITFVEAGILEQAKAKQERLNSTQEAVRILIKTIQIITANKTNLGNTTKNKRGGKQC